MDQLSGGARDLVRRIQSGEIARGKTLELRLKHPHFILNPDSGSVTSLVREQTEDGQESTRRIVGALEDQQITPYQSNGTVDPGVAGDYIVLRPTGSELISKPYRETVSVPLLEIEKYKLN